LPTSSSKSLKPPFHRLFPSWFVSNPGRLRLHPIIDNRGASHESARGTDCTRRLLRNALLRREGSGKIDSWIILNSGGGPTPDKPEVLIETPSDLNRVNSFLNLRGADIWSGCRQWLNKGAFFLSERLDNHGWEWRCYIRDPDGYLIEVGQYTQMALDRFKNYVG
jgi:hypothetical protein